MTNAQRAVLEEAIADYTIACLNIKGQQKEASKLKARWLKEAAARQLKLLLDSLMEPV